MSGRNRSNVLLVEILIAVLFFMLSAVVLVRVFAAARNMSVRSGVETRALAEAQNVADIVCAAQDVDAALQEGGFVSSHGVWTRDDGDYTLYIEGGIQPCENGSFWQGEVRAYYKKSVGNGVRSDEALFALPCLRYWEAAS